MIALSWGRRISFEALCVDRCAPYWTFRRHLDRPSTDGEIGFRPPWSRSPPESSRLPGCPTRQRVGTGSREVSRPFDDITRASPVCDDPSTFVAVPLSGFSQPLSGFSSTPELRGLVSCRRPSVGFSLQSVVPRQGREPLSRPHAPLQFSAAVPEVRCSRSHPPGSSRLPRLRVVRLAIPGARSPFPPRSRVTSSTAWTPFTGTTPFPRLRLLRSLDPLANPYSRPPVARRPRADALLGFRPSRAFVRPSLGPSHDPTDRYVRRGASAAPTRGATSRRRVRTLRPHGRVVLVGARRAELPRDVACRLSATTLPPSTFVLDLS